MEQAARARHIDHARTDAGSGFTLIEVTIAAIMLMIVLIPMGYLMDTIVGQAATQSETTLPTRSPSRGSSSWRTNRRRTSVSAPDAADEHGRRHQLRGHTELNWADTSGTSLCITGASRRCSWPGWS